MKVLVTGAASVLGKAIHRLIMGKDKSSYEFLDYSELDVSDREAVMRLVESERYDVIVNCADYGDVEQAEAYPKLAEAVNHRGAENLAQVARMWNAVLIQISTDQVFSGRNNRPYREDDETEPLNVYGKTKLAGEEAIRNSGCRYVIIRTPMLYSEDSPFFCDWKDTLSYMKLNRDVSATKRAFTPTYADDLAKAIYQIVDHRLVDSDDISYLCTAGFRFPYMMSINAKGGLAVALPLFLFLFYFGKLPETCGYFTAFASGKFLVSVADCAMLWPGFAIEFILVGIHAQFWVFPEQRFKRFAPFACLPRTLRHHRDETEQLFVRPYLQRMEVVNPRSHVVGMLPRLYLVGADVINHLGDYLITHILSVL